MSRRIILRWLASIALVAFTLQPAAYAASDSSAACSLPSGSPLTFRSTCSLVATHSVAAGESLEISSSELPILDVDTDGACVSPLASPRNLSGSVTLTLSCAAGLTAGTPFTVVLRKGDFYPFRVRLTVTYNADNASAVAETLTLTSVLAPPLTVNYPAGWNMVGATTGTVLQGTEGPLYTWQAGDTDYEVLPHDTPLEAGVGYWAFFPQPTSVTLASVIPAYLTIPLPAGQWIMVGSASQYGTGIFAASGAPLTLEAFDPSSQLYVPSRGFPIGAKAGQAVWVYSATEAVARLDLPMIP
jgi:hypothetical protein